MEAKKLYHIDIDLEDNVKENARLLFKNVIESLSDRISFVEFHNSLNTREDLEVLGVAAEFKGNPLASYLEFVSNENLMLDPVVLKYGIPKEMGYTYSFEGVDWLIPTIVYAYSFKQVSEQVLTGDVFYLETLSNPNLNPYNPRFFDKNDDNVPVVWVDNESLLLYITNDEKVALELVLDKDLEEVDVENNHFSSPEVEIHSIELGVNN